MATVALDASINPPDQDSYQYTPGQQMLSVQLEGGGPRLRRDYINPNHTVTCNYSCTREQYLILMGFFRERAQQFSKPFQANLVIDVPVLIPYICRLVGEPKLINVQGFLYTVQVTYSVNPNPMKSYTMFLNNVSSPRVIDAGSIDYPAEVNEFPAGRTVRITMSTGLVSGVSINLDGDYVILANLGGGAFTLTNAAVINPNWALLAGTQYHPPNGAVVLLPV